MVKNHSGIFFLTFLLLLYSFVVMGVRDEMVNRELNIKIGYVPPAVVMNVISCDQKNLIAATFISKVISYYGSLSLKSTQVKQLSPELIKVKQVLWSAVKLDPYNMDAYYFIQAVYGWEQRFLSDANAFLEYGIQFRDWDFYMPFFLGFNYSHRGGDYIKAAEYYKRAYYLSGMELMGSLAGKYLYEANDIEKAISYLTVMLKTSRNDAIKKSYERRLQGLESIKLLQSAVDNYFANIGKIPSHLNELVSSGYLESIPVDSYGGDFYIDEFGFVKTTSSFAKGFLRQQAIKKETK